MRTLIAYATGVFAAAALPLALLVLLAALSGDVLNRFTLRSLAWAGVLTIAVVGAVAVLTLLLLHMLRAVRWLWLGVAGYSAGFLLYGAFLMSTRADPFALPMTPVGLLIASMLGGVVGWICASVCWLTIDWVLRPSDVSRSLGR